MDDNKSFEKQYEDGDITLNRLFKEQDAELAGKTFIGCGIFALVSFIVLIIVLIGWIL